MFSINEKNSKIPLTPSIVQYGQYPPRILATIISGNNTVPRFLFTEATPYLWHISHLRSSLVIYNITTLASLRISLVITFSAMKPMY
jgi:hypothetical protein